MRRFVTLFIRGALRIITAWVHYPSLRELEEIWGERAQAALSTYQKAKAVCSQAMEDIVKKWSREGQLALLEAMDAETVGREEYQRVLRIFNDLHH